jgi:putative DNA-invertase from lambdoid prophage Rac
MSVYGYIRVSTGEQAASGLGLEGQEAAIRGYAAQRGWQLDKVFVDAGISGAIPFEDRPQGGELMACLRPGDAVVAAKLDRAFRGAFDALGTLQRLQASRVGLHLLDMGGDVSDGIVGKLLFTILAAVAEQERGRIGERIRSTKATLRIQGRHQGGERPYGFQIGAGKVLVEDPAEQANIAAMRALRAEGLSLRKIGIQFGFPSATSVMRILDRQPVP